MRVPLRRFAVEKDLGGGAAEDDGDFDPFAPDEEGEMDDRLAQAALEATGARMDTPEFLDEREVTAEDEQELLLDVFKVVVEADRCRGCGAMFQTERDGEPGFVPEEKLRALVAQAQAEEAQGDLEVCEAEDGSRIAVGAPQAQASAVEDEDVANTVLLDTLDDEGMVVGGVADDAVVLDRPPKKLKDPRETVCSRCHKLRYYGKVDTELRAGWSTLDTLTPQAFEDTISVIREIPCIVLYVTDIFDFHGSVLTNIRRLVGNNEVLVAANKADLLPRDMKPDRVRQWITREMRALGLGDVNNRNVHLVSCFTGYGISTLLRSVRELAAERNCDVYVVGAANVGKSTFINRLIDMTERAAAKAKGQGQAPKKRRNKGAADLRFGAVTTSNLPGTTLGMVRVQLDRETSLYDTPGLMLAHQLTSRLDDDELKAVVPQKRVDHVSLRIGEGKSMMLGGLARLDLVEGMPAFFTAFVSNDVKVHPTRMDKVPDLLENQMGELLYPPASKDRYDALGPWTTHEVTIAGAGWKLAAKDIVLGGLGWVAITGSGDLRVAITVPRGVRVGLRDPLMPFEARATTAKYTGVRSRKIGKKTKYGGRRS